MAVRRSGLTLAVQAILGVCGGVGVKDDPLLHATREFKIREGVEVNALPSPAFARKPLSAQVWF